MSSKSRGRMGKKTGFRRLGLVLLSSTIALSLLIVVIYFQRSGSGPKTKPKALIVDGLLHHPNQGFIEEASRLLVEAGFEVDVVGAEGVTVEFYRLLPSRGYRLIILRVHAGPVYRHLPGGGKIAEGTVLFTTEVYDEKRYVDLQAAGLLAVARIYGRPEVSYFAVPPWFFEEASTGRFENSTVILDSCYGFYYEAPYIMAEAFLYKGAKAFIGWDGEVQAEHTDRAVLELLRALLVERLSVKEAVDRVMKLVGPDPYYRSIMLYHPPEAASMRLKPVEGS
ncbi:hypothetical protein KEJ13_03915 [Candidatus Bathyarchaeota archaeon]|nr:hypothetical protein [Candidatus Bathyarchaeota archaeon]